MKLSLFLATFAILVWGAAPALAGPVCSGPDTDSDTVLESCDNCLQFPNPAQDDTDGDGCGNLCDPDYSQDGSVGFPDFTDFIACFNGAPYVGPEIAFCTNIDLTTPVGPDNVSFPDFTTFIAFFNTAPPGPSGTTSGTTACP